MQLCDLPALVGMIVAIAASGCSSSSGGGTGGTEAAGGGANSTTTSAGMGSSVTCGEDGGPVCAPGTPCDPLKTNCTSYDINAKCQTIDENCNPLDLPVCDQGSLGCGTGDGGPLVCACNGLVVPMQCAIQNSRPAPSLDGCATETYSCGDELCTSPTEVCVHSPESGQDDPHCESAEARGCMQFGIADCRCLEYSQEAETCRSPELGQAFIEAVQR